MAQIVGVFRIGNDVQIRYTPSGESVCNLSLAFNYGKKGDDGRRPSQWIEASFWGKRAESMQQYLTKGSSVYAVIDAPHIETYEGKNGPGHKLVGRILEIEFTGGKRDGGDVPFERQAPAQPRPAPAASKPAGNFEDFDDDIPF